jgi:hypothetical protein
MKESTWNIDYGAKIDATPGKEPFSLQGEQRTQGKSVEN